jgi:glutamate---cysteine ligase / carboxylate-amine ligase
MPLPFHGSSHHTIGVEIELQVIDPDTFDLSPQSDLVLKTCKEKGIQRVKAEIHQSMLEIDTEIAHDVKTCHELLKSRLQQLHAVTTDLGLQLAVLGTHPFQLWTDRQISKKDRYQNLYQKFQWLVRRMNVYGLHVHVGLQSAEQALIVSKAMLKYLPYLLALSANSPFWHGVDTGMDSCRVNIMESFPLSGLPNNFSNWEELEHYHDTLQKVGAIGSLKDLYWHIRPNVSYGTIEVRICDAMTTLDETIALVAFIQCLVVSICREHEQNPQSLEYSKELRWLGPENQWIAARDGLEGEIIVDLHGTRKKISEGIYELIEDLLPIARHLNCHEELLSLKQIIENGNGAQRQRRVFNETQSLKDVMKNAIQ